MGLDSAGHGSRRWAGKRTVIALGAAAVLALALLYASLAPVEKTGPAQPIRFSHRAHVGLMTCEFCHEYYRTRQVAGRPDLFRCMLCHAYGVSDQPEADKLRRMAETQQRLAWRRVTRLPPHVRFSHQRHVAVGKVDCAACHGAIARTTAPPARPLVAIRMNFCLDCHRSAAVQLTAGSLQALQGDALSRSQREALRALQHKRFRSGEAFLAALAGLAGSLPAEAERGRIVEALTPAGPVTTDCAACHR